MKVQLADWKCSDRERELVNRVLDSGWITYGPFCKELEKLWSSYHGCRYGVINNSGTSALQLAWRALKELHGWDSKSEILVPAITFPATINMVIESGLVPVLCDVERDGMISIKDMERKATKRTKGVCLVHLWGTPYPRKHDFIKLCSDMGLRVVEDSCETIDRGVGHIGDVSCFSMYFNHIISAGVGGMCCTNSGDLEYLMRSLANHGMIDVNAQPKYKRFQFARVGYSFRVTEMEAALGVAQFERIDDILARRRGVCELIDDGFVDIGFDKYADLIGGTMMYPIVLKAGKVKDNKQFMDILNSRGIETREALPITNQAPFKKYVSGSYPVAERFNRYGVFLPIHPGMNKRNCGAVVKAVASAMCEMGPK